MAVFDHLPTYSGHIDRLQFETIQTARRWTTRFLEHSAALAGGEDDLGSCDTALTTTWGRPRGASSRLHASRQIRAPTERTPGLRQAAPFRHAAVLPERPRTNTTKHGNSGIAQFDAEIASPVWDYIRCGWCATPHGSGSISGRIEVDLTRLRADPPTWLSDRL